MNPLLSALVAAGIISPDDAERINRNMDADAMRAWAEQRMAVAVQNGLSAQQARVVDLVRKGNVTEAALADFWRAEDERLYAALRATLEEVGSEQAIGMAVRMGADDAMWRTVNEAVLSWVNDYYTAPDPAFVGSIPNLNVTAREQFAPLFEAWNRGTLDNAGRGLPQLVQALEPVFGPARAEKIAVTEVTRVFTESIVAAGDANEAVTGYEWMTANDEIVCPICAPLNGQRVRKGVRAFGTVSFPPAHPNCRCSVTEITLGMEGLEERGKQPPKPPEWKPAMTRAEADAWARESAVKVDTYHVTQGVANERSIAANGFDLNKKNFGRMWGDGVYVGTDSKTAAMYRKWTGKGARTMTIRVDVRNPAIFDAANGGFGKMDIAQAVTGKNYRQALKEMQSVQGDLSKFLQKNGFDALELRNVGVDAGGNQMVVFDPKKVVVIND